MLRAHLNHRLGFQGRSGNHRVDRGSLWTVGRRGSDLRYAIGSRRRVPAREMDKTHSRIRRPLGNAIRTETRSARASATLRPKLIAAADVERAAMVSDGGTTAVLRSVCADDPSSSTKHGNKSFPAVFESRFKFQSFALPTFPSSPRTPPCPVESRGDSCVWPESRRRHFVVHHGHVHGDPRGTRRGD